MTDDHGRGGRKIAIGRYQSLSVAIGPISVAIGCYWTDIGRYRSLSDRYQSDIKAILLRYRFDIINPGKGVFVPDGYLIELSIIYA